MAKCDQRSVTLAKASSIVETLPLEKSTEVAEWLAEAAVFLEQIVRGQDLQTTDHEMDESKKDG